MYLPNFNIFDPDVKYLVGLLCPRNGSGATSVILENTGTMDIRRLIPLLKWVRNIMILVDLHQFSAQTLHALLPLLKAMRALKDVKVRDDLSNALLDMTPESVQLWLEVSGKAKQYDAIARFCILPFIGTNPCLKPALDVDGTRSRPVLKDFRASRPFIKALRSLTGSGMPQDMQSRILQVILGNDLQKIETIVAQLRKLDTLLGLDGDKVRKLATTDNTQGIDAMLQETLNERLGCGENKPIDMVAFEKVFGAYREPDEQLLRMGTDVEGSCQRIDGDPEKNRGLIGTVMDGKSRLCLIVGKSGAIKARALLRLMWNEDEEEHCLFMEPIYPPLLNDSVKGRLTEFAKTIAVDLGLEMVSIVEGKDALECEDTLRSGPIHAPLYSDGAHGIQSAEFSIDSCAAHHGQRLAWIHEFD
jgi:hypothetical protein